MILIKDIMKKTALALALIAILFSCGVTAGNSEEIKENQKKVKASIEKLDLKIVVSTIMPNVGPTIPTSDGYYLKIHDGVVNTYLPFFGESHSSVMYGADDTGIKVEDAETDIKVDKGKKGKKTLRFNAKSGNDTWSFIVDIWPEGQANISCTCATKTGMNFIGEVEFE